MKIDLYHETVKVLSKNSKSLSDIVRIGTTDATIGKEQFFERAKETIYDNGYDGAIIARDLIIVGSNWWLSRGEDDGCEWWVFNTIPQKAKKRKRKFDLKESALFGY